MSKFTYDPAHQSQISFPLGGIGSGCVGLAGNGRLIDWEIYNRPSKGSYNGVTHFAVKCERGGQLLDARVLQGDLPGPYIGSFTREHWEGAFGWGPELESMAGFPHFRSNNFTGRFPLAKLAFEDETFPGKASLQAFNPLIPMDEKNSSLPAAFFAVTLENTNSFDADYTAAFSLRNPHEAVRPMGQPGAYGLFFESTEDKDNPAYGTMAVLTDADDLDVQEHWYRGGWRDAQTVFWRQFTDGARLPVRKYDDARQGDTSTLAAHVNIPAGQSRTVRFLLSWSSPTCECYWDRSRAGTWKNWYASAFPNASDSAFYCMKNWDSLYTRTLAFIDTLTRSSLPEETLEAVVSNLSILKSPTVLRLEDGSIYGFEGVSRHDGICEGSCTHVWNYAYAFPFLFPALERSMRSLDYQYNLRDDGGMRYRIRLPLESNPTGNDGGCPCADGQFGGVIKTYRDWKISGDDAWLRSLWPEVKRSIEYAWSEENLDHWDRDKDGVLEGRQHHTLDMKLFGPNSWLTGFYLGALKAGAEMADYLGERENAAQWRTLFEKGKVWADRELFNGEYYHQKIDLRDRERLARYNGNGHECSGGDIVKAYWNDEAGEIKYQVGEGCEIQQLMAQWHANLCGLGEIFDKAQVKTALKFLYQYNFVPNARTVANLWRNYCLNDEGGGCSSAPGRRENTVPWFRCPTKAKPRTATNTRR